MNVLLLSRASSRFLLAATLALAMAPAVRARTIEDEGVWVNVTAIGKVKDRLLYFAEVQPRFTGDARGLNQLIARGALGWQVTPKLQAYGGYAHLVLPTETGPDRNEDRLFGQLTWTIGAVAGGALSTRTRIEHRRLSQGHEVGWRVRHLVRYAHQIAGPRYPKALVTIEPMVALNDTDWGARRGFDQIRTFVGLEIPLVGKSTVEPGYLNQTINAAGGVTRVNHIASVTLWIRT